MIAWQNAAALWALPLAVVPFVIHLLRTHHARRVAFPSLRFVPVSRTAAVRMRLPSDVLLMLVRIAIVALAVGALAGPILLTEARMAAWNVRTARAVVVDISDSMRDADGSGVPPEGVAGEAAAAELRTATYGARFDSRDLNEGLARAVRWLSASPPARREVVVISDLQRGALGRPDTMMPVTDGIGVRFIPIGRPARMKSFDGAPLVGAGDVGVQSQAIEATVDTTAVAIEARPGKEMAGLRLSAAPGGEQAVARLLRAVATAGAPAGSRDEPLAIQFAGAPSSAAASLATIKPGWMLRTVLRLREDSALASSSEWSAVSAPQAMVPDPWTIVVRNRDGSPRVRAAASLSELLLDVAAPADSLFAAAVVQAALTARVDVNGYAEHEIARLDETALSRLNRPAGPVARDAWRRADSTDARWFWLLAMALLGVEQWLRAQSAHHRQQEVTRAAA
jgi:Aerotolerance regulator N-terminal